MNRSAICEAAMGAEPRDHDGLQWSVDVFRQVRRADLRTGYAGPKPSLMQRVRRMFTKQR